MPERPREVGGLAGSMAVTPRRSSLAVIGRLLLAEQSSAGYLEPSRLPLLTSNSRLVRVDACHRMRERSMRTAETHISRPRSLLYVLKQGHHRDRLVTWADPYWALCSEVPPYCGGPRNPSRCFLYSRKPLFGLVWSSAATTGCIFASTSASQRHHKSGRGVAGGVRGACVLLPRDKDRELCGGMAILPPWRGWTSCV